MRNVCWGIRNKKNNREYEDEGESMRLNAAMDTYFVQREGEREEREKNLLTTISVPIY